MMKIMKAYRMTARMLGALLIAVGMTGCVVNEEPRPCPEPETHDMALRFRVETGKMLTRVDPDNHPEEEALLHEWTINWSDTRLLVFQGTVDKPAEAILRYDTQSGKAGEVFITGSADVGYTVLIEPITLKLQDADADVPLTLVVLANVNPGGSGHDEPVEFDMTYETLPAQMTVGASTLQTLLDSRPEFKTGTGWNPEDTRYARIPMFGMNSRVIPQAELSDPEQYPVVEGPTVNLLRAVAKIEIFDGLQAVDPGSGTAVTAVEPVANPNDSESGFDARGCLIPDGGAFASGKFTDGHQVKGISLPVSGGTTLGYKPFTKALTGGTMELNGKTYTGLNYWRIYCPEQKLEVGSPAVKVTVSSPYPDASVREFDFDFAAAAFPDYKSMFMRNHIYRILLTGVNHANMTLQYVVCPVVDWGVIEIPPFN